MKFYKFLKDEIAVGDIAVNTAGASGDTSQSIEKRAFNESEVIKFSINNEKALSTLNKLREKYSDAVFTYEIHDDIIGDTMGEGMVETPEIWVSDILSTLEDNKWIDIKNKLS